MAKYFIVDDGGIDYLIVAEDLAQAKQLFRDHGIEFVDNDGWSHPIDAPEVAFVEWIEITQESAARRYVMTGDDGAGPRKALTECAPGDFFCSEY